MPTLRIWQRFEWTSNGQQRGYGDLVVPKSITYSEPLYEKVVAVPDNAATLIFNTTIGFAVPAITFLIVPDVDMFIAWVGTLGADSSIVRVESGTPFLLSTGITKNYNATLNTRIVTGGDVGANILEIYAFQNSAAPADVYILGLKQ